MVQKDTVHIDLAARGLSNRGSGAAQSILSKLRYQYYRTGRTGGLEAGDLSRRERFARQISAECINHE